MTFTVQKHSMSTSTLVNNCILYIHVHRLTLSAGKVTTMQILIEIKKTYKDTKSHLKMSYDKQNITRDHFTRNHFI